MRARMGQAMPWLLFMILLGAPPCVSAQELGGTWGTARAEDDYYRIVDLAVPKALSLEAGSFCMLPDGRLAVGTRRGEIFLVTGAFEEVPDLRLQRFASGLDEVLGLGYRDGAFYVTQQTEVTRIRDTNGDGRADRFDTLSDVWGFEHYHEFAFGSPVDADGNIWVVLGLSSSYHYRAKFRGWSFKITPDGRSIPIASGIRSAGGVAPNEHGVMFYTESQGPWNGSCSLKHLRPGGFMGHPISFPAYDLVPGMKRPLEPESGSRLAVESKRVKELVPYAVVFPYRKMGQSISSFRVDRTGGKFGPFENQLFVGDYSLSIVMRATTELVEGVWQGACYQFREGLSTGILAVEFSPDGYLVTGGTNRGWPVRGNRQYVMERLQWTGRMPFEIERISIRPQGFHIEFTKPVSPEVAARPETYRLSSFTHVFQKHYGSPEVDKTTPVVRTAKPAADGRSVTLTVDGMVEGHVHAFDLAPMRGADGGELLHKLAYYTVNRIPGQSRKEPAPAAAVWPGYRGPRADGHADATALPRKWSEKENVRWKTAIHGRAWSSPVVAGDEVWVSTASKDGRKLSVLAVDLASGEVRHDEQLFAIENPQFAHAFNTYASPSPVIDGEHIFVSFGSPGTACIHRASRKVVWRRTDLECDHFRGAGSSPLVYDDLVVLTMDGADVQYLVALDKKTGATRWRTDRSTDFGDLDSKTGKPKADGDLRKSYATPIIIDVDGKDQLISPGAKAAFAYEPRTGKEIWRVRYGNHSSGSRTVYGHGLVFINTGYSQARLLAVDPRGRGDVTDTHVKWRLRRRVPKKPAPVLVGDDLYMINDGGIVSCVAAKTGKVRWFQRVAGEYSASLIYADGHIYAFSQNGEGIVFRPGDRFLPVAENQLGSGFMASPAAVGRSLVVRSKTHLYRLERTE